MEELKEPLTANSERLYESCWLCKKLWLHALKPCSELSPCRELLELSANLMHKTHFGWAGGSPLRKSSKCPLLGCGGLTLSV